MEATLPRPRGACLCAVLLLLLWSLRLYGQPVAVTNQVLELDGTNSYVQLPPHIFDELTEATVELWVKWDRFGPGDALAFCFGDEGQSMFIGNHEGSTRLKFALYDTDGVRHPLGGRLGG